MVTVTIGATARDYSTISAFEADLDNGGVFTASEEARGECYADSDFTESTAVTFNGGTTLGISGSVLSVASGERHDGAADSSGVTITALSITLTGNLPRTVEWLDMDYGGANVSPLIVSGTNTNQIVISHNLIHDTVRSGGSALYGVNLSAGLPCDVFRNIIYNIEQSGANSAAVSGIYNAGAPSQTHRYLNNTLYNVIKSAGSGNAYGIELFDDADVTCSNNLVVGTEGSSTSGTAKNYSVATSSNMTAQTNFSSDSTAPGSATGEPVAAGVEFVSTTGGSEDLRLASGSESEDAGTDVSSGGPTNIDLDIAGTTVSGTWDVGAFEFVAAAGGGVKPPSGLTLLGVGT